MDDRPMSRGSKQKIMKLKEELHVKSNADPQSLRVRQLKESYDLAVLKMNEMNSAQGSNLYVKVHGKKAGKAYSALSSIIYASIAAAKIEGLELFVKQTVAALPANMIDLEEWNHVLTLAKDCRASSMDSSLIKNGLNSSSKLTNEFMKKYQLLYFLATNPIRNTRDEMILFRKSVIDELTHYQNYCFQIMQTIFTIVKRFSDYSNNDMNMKRIGALKQEIYDLNNALNATRQQADDALKEQGESFQQQYNEVVAKLQEDQKTFLASRGDDFKEVNSQLQLKNQENEILQQKFSDLQKKLNDLEDFTSKQTVDFLSNATTNQILSECLHQVETLTHTRMNQELSDCIHKLQQELLEEKVKVANFDKTKEKEMVDMKRTYEERIAKISQEFQVKEQEFFKKENNPQMQNLVKEQKNQIADLESKLSKQEKDFQNKEIENEQLFKEEKQKVSLLEKKLEEKEKELTNRPHNSKQEELISGALVVSSSPQVEEDQRKKILELNEKNQLLSKSLEEFSDKTEKMVSSLVGNIEGEKKKSSQLVDFISSLEQQLKENSNQLNSYENTIQEMSSTYEKQLNALLSEKQAEINSLTNKLSIYISSKNETGSSSKETASLASIKSVKDPKEKCQKLEALLDQLTREKELMNLERTENESTIEQVGHENLILKIEINEIKKNEFLVYLKDKIKDLQTYEEKYLVPSSNDEKQQQSQSHSSSFHSFFPLTSHYLIHDLLKEFQKVKNDIIQLETEIITSTKNSENENTLLMSPLFINTLQNWKNQFYRKYDEIFVIQDKYEKLLFSQEKTPLTAAPAVEQQLKNMEKERNILKDKYDFLVEVKADNERIIKDLREEMNRMTDEVISLKEMCRNTVFSQSVDTLETDNTKRKVGFVDSPEVFLFNTMSSNILSTPESSAKLDQSQSQSQFKSQVSLPSIAEGNNNNNHTGPPTSAIPEPNNSNGNQPEKKETAANEQQSPRSQPLTRELSITKDLTRNSAYYEAQSVVLDAIKAGMMKVKDSTKPVVASSGPMENSSANSSVSSKRSFSEKKEGGSAKASLPIPMSITVPATVVPQATKTEEEKHKTQQPETKVEQAKPVVPEEEKPKKERKPFANPHSHLDLNDPFTKSVVKLQAVGRSFTARQRVRRIQMARKATSEGILVACYGTTQGETGWYTSQDQLFYFCAQEEEFLLMCGPITQDIYELALEDLVASMTPTIMTPVEQLPDNSNEESNMNPMDSMVERYKKRPPKFPKNITIDHLGLQATRIQIETLLHDISLRDHYINEYEIQLNDLNNFINSLQEENNFKNYELNKLFIINKEQSESLSLLNHNYSNLLAKMKNYSEKNLETMKTTIQSLGETKLKTAFLKLTCVIRGFLGRQRVKRIKQMRLADQTGILVAMKDTNQGESGWYMGPNGSIFYFVLKDVRNAKIVLYSLFLIFYFLFRANGFTPLVL
jgi:uncharacterized protein YoxC